MLGAGLATPEARMAAAVMNRMARSPNNAVTQTLMMILSKVSLKKNPVMIISLAIKTASGIEKFYQCFQLAHILDMVIFDMVVRQRLFMLLAAVS
jgi:hypothetical protein